MCGPQTPVEVTAGVAKSWNHACVPVLEYTCARIEAGSQYGRYLMARLRAGNVFDLQTYACRQIRGGGGHSEHAHAVAMDVRPFANPLSDRGLLVTDFDKFGGADGELFLHSIGDPVPGIGPLWQWGGALYSNDVSTWVACFRRRGSRITTGRVDAMHFEVDDAVSTADAAKLAGVTPPEVDDVALTKSQSDALDFIAAHEDDFSQLFAFAHGVAASMAGAAAAPDDPKGNMAKAGYRFSNELNLPESGGH